MARIYCRMRAAFRSNFSWSSTNEPEDWRRLTGFWWSALHCEGQSDNSAGFERSMQTVGGGNCPPFNLPKAFLLCTVEWFLQKNGPCVFANSVCLRAIFTCN